MRQFLIATALLAAVGGQAVAGDVKVFGVQMSQMRGGAPDRVACMAIADGDCWTTDRKWYRLPRGQLQGIHGGVMGPTPGAFITAPLR